MSNLDQDNAPILRRIHKNKVVLIRWFDKQGIKSSTTYMGDPTVSIPRFIVTKDGFDCVEYFVVESGEPDEFIIEWMANNQVLAFGLIR